MIRDDLEDAFIGIWGLGLMGGSLAMALTPHCKLVSGIDIQPEVVELALERGVVSQASTRPEDILPEVDVLVLAVPVGVILQIVEQLPALCTRPLVVLDLGSTKTDIADAFESLPANFYPVAGHPMCGKSVLGLKNADPDLYRDAPFMLHPLERSQGRAFTLVRQIVEVIGAIPLMLNPDEHDKWVAATSHLPYLVASALALTVPETASAMSGPGYASTTRLAETPTSIMQDVLVTNRENILEILRDFQTQIGMLADKLGAGEMDVLEAVLNIAAQKRAQILSGEGAA